MPYYKSEINFFGLRKHLIVFAKDELQAILKVYNVIKIHITLYTELVPESDLKEEMNQYSIDSKNILNAYKDVKKLLQKTD